MDLKPRQILKLTINIFNISNLRILFDKTAQSLSINNLHIFTTDKLQVNATFKIFYFLE